MRTGDFAELRAFAAVVRHGSFTRAAAFLGVSPPALSQSVRNLEVRMGHRLLNRTTRSVALTPEGARLAELLLPILDNLETVTIAAFDWEDVPSGPLRINAARVAVPFLSQVIPGFLEIHRRISLELEVNDQLVDIVREGFDAGIRLGERLDDDMIAVRFGSDLRMAVVAAPQYLETYPAPRHPKDLAHHRCLVMRSPTDGSPYRWEFERDGHELKVGVDGPLTCNDPAIRLIAAKSGVGLAYMFEHQVLEALDSGALIRVLDDWTPPYPGCFLYYPGRRNQRPSLRAFIEYCRKVMATHSDN